MDTADATGGKDLDPGKMRADHRRGNRGRPGAASGKADGKVGAGKLGHVLRLPKRVKLCIGQAYMNLVVHHGNRRGHCAMGAHFGLNSPRGFHILWKWHAMGDDCAFKGDNGVALGAGINHFRR